MAKVIGCDEDAISITNSTFTIEKKVLTPTVNKQVVKQNAQALPDLDGWSVEGLVNATVDGVEINDTKESLNAQALAMSSTTNVTNDGTITLTIPNNGNYKFVDNNGNDIFTATGTLIVISETTLMLDPADLDLVSKIQTAANSQIDYNIAFAQGFELNTQEWYAMVLPFATTPAELVNALGTYVLVNKLSSAVKKEDGSADVKFALEWNKIEAGEPFLIKTAIKVDNNQNSIPVDMSQVQFAAKGIVKDITDVVKGVATFTGTYENGKSVKWYYNLDGTENTEMRYRWLSHTNTLRPGKTANDPETTEAEKKAKYYLDNEWKQPKSNAHTLIPMEAFLILAPEITKANIFVEDIENGFTAIKNLSADQVNGMTVATKGWYTLNGVKLQGAPTEKGIYINNGKKVVIK